MEGDVIMETKLSKLERVPLREAWEREDSNFTKWLAKEENLDLLGEAIGIDLELLEVESAVGSYRADIYARASDGRFVVIENQLEKSNHDHLGKVITYASGKDAHVAVWIVSQADEKHSQAVEWLNAHTDEDIGFFLIEMELWRIGDSDPAPKFNVVERPNDWGKVMKGYDDLSPAAQVQLDYWQAFHDRATADEAFMRVLRPQKPLAQNWTTLSIGTSICNIQLTVDTQKGRISCGYYISGDGDLYASVKAAKQDLADAVGVSPTFWEGAKDSGVRFFKEGCNIKSHPERWPEYIEWQMRAALALKRAFDGLR